MLITTVILSSVITQSLVNTSRESFTSIPQILNHLSVDTSNVDRDDNDPSKRTILPAFVISGLSNGVSIDKLIGVHNMKQNRSGLRITNGPDPISNACWGVDYASENSLVFRHYPKGFHPPEFSNEKQYTDYYNRWNWFLRIFPNTETRYSYPPIF